MLEKYEHKFRKMYEEILINKCNPIEIINEHIPLFKEEGIGALGIVHYLEKYIKEKKGNYLSQ